MASLKMLPLGLVAALSSGCGETERETVPEPTPPRAALQRHDAGAPTPEEASLGPAKTEEAKLTREVECWNAVQGARWSDVRRCFGATSLWAIVDGVPPMEAHGVDDIVEVLKEWRTGFPDLQLSLQLKLGRGDEVAAMYIVSGTHLGPFKGWPATRKRIGLHVAELATIRDDGTIHIELLVLDERALWHQIGVRQDPAAGGLVEDAGGERPVVVARNDEVETANVKAMYGGAIGAIGAIGQKDSAGYDALLADTVKLRSYGDGVSADGKKAVLAAMKRQSSGLIDADNGIGRVWGAGDWVVAEIFPTRTTRDRKVSRNVAVHFLRFESGKIVEHHVFANELHTAWRRGQVKPEDLAPPPP